MTAQSRAAATATTSSPTFQTYFCSPAPLMKRTKPREVATRTVPLPPSPTVGSSKASESVARAPPPRASAVTCSPARSDIGHETSEVHDWYGL